MNRTLRATVVAGVAVFATVFGLGVLLGFDPATAAVTGVVLGAAMASLIWFAARRAETFHDPGHPAPNAADVERRALGERRTDT